MDLAALYSTWSELARSGAELTFWQDFYVKFYQAFIEADRCCNISRAWAPRCSSRRRRC